MTVTKKPRADGSFYFWIDFTHEFPDGTKHRVRQNSQYSTERGAEKEEQDLREALAKGYRAGKKPTDAPALTFAEAVTKYLTPDAALNNGARWKKDKRQTLERTLLPRFGAMPLTAITNDELRSFLAEQMARKTRRGAAPAPGTLNSYLRIVSRTLRLAFEAGRLPAMPKIPYVTEAKVQPVDESLYLGFEELPALLDAAAPWPETRRLLLVGAKTGLRIGEILALRWDAIDFAAGQLMVRWTLVRGEDGWVEEKPKSGHDRAVSLGPSALAALREQRHLRGPYVFCKEDGGQMNYDEADTCLERVVRAAGPAMAKVKGFHILRHTAASHLVMSGVPLETVQVILGHEDLKTTQRYRHLAPNTLKAAMEKLG
jgi:integrase